MIELLAAHQFGQRQTGQAHLDPGWSAPEDGFVWSIGPCSEIMKVPMWMFLKAARMGGVDKLLLSELAYYFRYQNEGAFALGGPTDHVLEVTGREPEDFETITRRYAAQPMAQRTIANTLRACGAFMSVPMRPGMNSARYERQQDFPAPFSPRLALQDAAWKQQRGITALTAKVPALKLAASA